MAKKKVDKKPQNISEAMGLQNIINNEKVDFVIGLFFVVCSIVLLIAFVSYFYNSHHEIDIKILTLSFLFAIITLLSIPNNTKLTG